MKNKAFVINRTIAVILFSCIFFSCAGINENNGVYHRADIKADNMSDKIWTIEDYNRELGTFPGLDAETEWRIIRDSYYTHPNRRSEPGFSGVTISDYYTYKYFGTYSGYVVIEILIALESITWDEFSIPAVAIPLHCIDDIVLPWRSTPAVWNDGKFYNFRELYDSGTLTRADLKSIAKYHFP